jgi:predicted TIM-barrel fold metal-dependent hydrolase
MPYAHRAEIYDADTHMMERPDWIAQFADADIRPHLAPFVEGRAETLAAIDDALARFQRRREDAEAARKADAEFMAMRYKGWHGLGAFDGRERAHANDLLGFRGHLVFPTSAFNQVIAARDPRVLVGGVRALNRGLAAFCAEDARMFGTAYLPLGQGPQMALALLEEIIAAGFAVVLVDTIPPRGGRSFTHPDYDTVWARIQDADLSVTLHVGANGGEYNAVPDAFYANGRALPPHADGDAPRDALSYMTIHNDAVLFLSAMILDGVLERFPRLRIAVVELGASWIVSWLKHLDQSHRAFRRLQDLSHLTMLPSDYVRRAIKVTPFAGEDIGWLLASGAEDLLMFATDYPHHEGTDDPIGRFERTMDGVAEPVRQKFYADNFKAFMGARLVAHV